MHYRYRTLHHTYTIFKTRFTYLSKFLGLDKSWVALTLSVDIVRSDQKLYTGPKKLNSNIMTKP